MIPQVFFCFTRLRAASLAIRCWCPLLALLVLMWAGETAADEQPVPQLTAAQQQRLKKRDRYAEEMTKLRAQGKLAEAIAACQQMLALEREVFGNVHRDVAGSLQQLAEMYEEQDDFVAARKALEEVLAIGTKRYGEADWRVADGRRALEDLDRRKQFGPEERAHLKQASGLNNQVDQLRRAGKSQEALPLARKAAEIRGRILGQQHPDYAQSLFNLGAQYQALGLYGQAEPLLRRALEIRKKALGEAHPDYADSLNNLAELYQSKGDYTRAEPLFRRALEIRKKALGEAHPDYATSLINLATLYERMGDYARAEPLFRQAVEIYKKALGEVHPHYATSLNNLAQLYGLMGDYARAEPLYRQALEIRKKALGEVHPRYATSLNNLATLYQRMGDYARAEPLFRQALEIQKKALGEGHPDYATSLNNLAGLYDSMGDYARAEPLFRQALEIQKKALGEGHPDYATSLNNLAVLYDSMGDYTRAEPLFRQALAMMEALYPKDQYPLGHPDLAGSLMNWGYLLMAQAKYREAEPFVRDALAIYQNHVNRLAYAAAEAQALNFAASLPRARDVFLSVTRRRPQPDSADYVPVWQGKAAVTRILERRHLDLLAAGASPQTHERWQELLQTRRQLSRLALNPLPDAQARREALHQLTQRKEQLESDLAARLPSFGRWQELNRSGPDDLVQELPARCAFVDLLRYIFVEQDPKVPGRKGERGIPSYVAFVLRRGRPAQRVELGPATPIEQSLAQWRHDIEDSQESSAGQTLRHLVWEPLAEHLPPDTETVYLAPDGVLSRLPWPALPGRQANTVLLQEHALALVPHGHFLLDRLRAPRKAGAAGPLLAVGGVQYDQAPPSRDKPSEELLAAHRVERGGKPHAWPFLHGSLEEVNQVITLAGERPLIRRSGTEATTSQLLHDLPQARWAHLATHGFFADARFRTAWQLAEADFQRGRFGERLGQGARSPLVLSGLVLAGANLPVPIDNNLLPRDDGILSAEMIVDLPLENLELVVLSACESGLGEAGGGEGVFGLQRAFHLAGAHHVVASLWTVDDAITQELMTKFYENLWQKRLGRLEALRQAQLAVRQGEGNRAHPRYWAAWMLSGDPEEQISPIPTASIVAPPWWARWPLYAAGAGVLVVAAFGLVLIRRRGLNRNHQ